MDYLRIQTWKEDLSYYGTSGTGDMVTNAVVIDRYQVDDEPVVIAKLDGTVWQIVTDLSISVGDTISATWRDGKYYAS